MSPPSPFSLDQQSWIVCHYGKVKSMTQLRRDFCKQYGIVGRQSSKLQDVQFRRVIQRFNVTSSTNSSLSEVTVRRCCVTKKDVLKVMQYFTTSPQSSIRDAVSTLSLSFNTIWNLLRKKLKWKPYHFKRHQALSPNQTLERLHFCHFIATQPDDFFNSVVWTVEKWFHLIPDPNMENDHVWSPTDPYAVSESKVEGENKVTAWCAILQGKVLAVHWFLDERSRPITVDGAQYLNVLKNIMWPKVADVASRKQIWFMHDGARPYTTQESLIYLVTKFRERILSRNASIQWPAVSPDLNPVDYWFWGHVDSEIFRQKPKTLQQLMDIVEDFHSNIDTETVMKACSKLKKRSAQCIANRGGHFES